MSKHIRNNLLAIVCTIALTFAAAATGVEAQTEDPILDDEILCSIRSGDTYYVVPVALQSALETYLNAAGTVETASSFISRLPAATSTNAVRIEGATFGASLVQDLEALGYGTMSTLSQTEVPGASYGALHTL